MRSLLDVELFLQAPTGLEEPVLAVFGDRSAFALTLGLERAAPLAHPGAAAHRARNKLLRIELDIHRRVILDGRLGCLVALARQALLGLTQRLAPPLARAQMLRKLVTALGPVELVLAPIGLGDLGEDLARDLAEVAVDVHRRVGRDLCAVDRHHADRRHAGPRAQAEHAGEQVGQRLLVPDAELGDRRVIGRDVARDDAKGDVLDTSTLDPARRPRPARVRVKQ